MAKVAGESYPADLDPEEAEKWMKVLVNDFGGEAESKEAFAQAVGHKSTSSGTYRRKVADARKYGLMTPRGDYEATELGFNLANPRDKHERYVTIRTMLQNVPILDEIHDTLNGADTPGEFWRVVTEITDANPKEARDAAEWLELLYEELVRADRFLEGENSPMSEENEDVGTQESEPPAHESSEKAQSDVQPTPESGIYLKVGNDEVKFEDVNDINLQLCMKFLDSKKGNPEDGAVQTKLG